MEPKTKKAINILQVSLVVVILIVLVFSRSLSKLLGIEYGLLVTIGTLAMLTIQMGTSMVEATNTKTRPIIKAGMITAIALLPILSYLMLFVIKGSMILLVVYFVNLIVYALMDYFILKNKQITMFVVIGAIGIYYFLKR